MSEIAFETKQPIYFCAIDYSNSIVNVAVKGILRTDVDVSDARADYMRECAITYLTPEITKYSGNYPVEKLGDKRDEIAEYVRNMLATEYPDISVTIEDISPTADSIEPVAHLKKDVENVPQGTQGNMQFFGAAMSPGAAGMIGNLFNN